MNNLIATMRYMQNLDALALAVSAEMERQKLNTYEVAERARKKGCKIVHGTVWNVINRQVKEVRDKTIIALAQGLGMPEDRLFAILRGAGDDEIANSRFNQIAKGYAQLSPRDKRNLEPFLAAIEQTIEKALPVIEPEKVSVKHSGRKNAKQSENFIIAGGKKIPLVEEASSVNDEEDE